MTINNLKCPSCGSTPKYDKENQVYVCSYCGTELSRDFSIKPKKEIIDRMISLGKRDFWNEDYEHSYRKFCNALYYDNNNICVKYYKEISDIPRLFSPDIDLSWDDAYSLLKEIYSNKKEEKKECLEMSKDEKIDYINVLKDLLNQIIEYYEKHTISTLDMKKQLESIQNEIDRLCKK